MHGEEKKVRSTARKNPLKIVHSPLHCHDSASPHLLEAEASALVILLEESDVGRVQDCRERAMALQPVLTHGQTRRRETEGGA